MKNILIFLLLILPEIVYSQPPSNDDCSGAILLDVSSDFQGSGMSGNTLNATNSGFSNACNGVGDDDIWYKFEVTNTSSWVYMYSGPGDGVMVFYSGNCGSLDSITCVNEKASYDSELILLQNLTIGDTIFIRAFDAAVVPTEMGIYISVYTPPINDICANAIELVIPVPDESTYSYFNLSNAIDEGISIGSCGMNSASDVWYKFTASQIYYKIELMACEAVLELRHGSCPSTQIGCFIADCDQGIGFIERNDFVIGDTYYIRIYNLNYSVNQNAQSLYLYQPIPEPEDNCLSAEILTVSDQSCAFTSYDNNLGGATETLTPTDACSAGPYLDLWYKFEVIDATVAIKTNAYQGGNLAIAAFTGTSCSALTPVQCVNASGNGEAEFLYLTGLTIGDTIFIRVYDADLANTPINFSICVYTPPTNDFCANATEITITNGANCSGSITGNTQGAIGTGGCSGGTADDDVWYWFTATDTLHSIQLSNTTITSPVMEIFNSNCNGSQFECVQGYEFSSPEFIVGQSYYIRIFSFDDHNGSGSFQICVSEPPINILCNNAVIIPVNSSINCTTIQTGNSSGQGSTYAKYKFVATSESHLIYITPLSPMTSIGSTLKIFNTACDFISYIGYDYYNSVQRAYYNNFTIGNEYKFDVNNGFPTEGDYQICITETVPNDECTSGTIIPTASFNTTCNCDVMVSGSCVGATPSNISPYIWHDVWYSFVATTATMTFALSPTNGSSSVTGIVYSDCSTYLGFIGSSGLTLNNLVIGNEYSIRIKANNSDGNPGDFEMCIRALTNDYCDNPVTLTPQAGTSCSPTTGSNIGATPSNNTYCILPDKKDVWFQFTATATTHLIKVVSTTAGFYPSFFVFRKKTTASSCDMNCIQSSVDCTNFADTIDFIPNVAILNSLTIGATYLISVTNVFQDSITGNFNICVLTPGTTMNVWSTKAETYSTTETAKVGGYQFPMKRITLNMTGTTSPLIVTQVVVNTSGTTNTSDLRAAKLYYAGNQGSMSTFKSFKGVGESDPILFGAAITNPNGQLVFNGSQSIEGQSGEYKKYFYLVYDVDCNAIVGNQINGEVESITISSDTYIPFEAVNTSNTIDAQIEYSTIADGLWSNANTWYCGVPPNGPDILPITINHIVSVDDARQCGKINVNYLKSLIVNTNGILTLGQSSTGTATGHSNKYLWAQWGNIYIYGTLNVNGGISVGGKYGSNYYGQLNIEGNLNIDGNDGTQSGSGFGGITIGTNNLLGNGFINILDPIYNSVGYEFNFSTYSNINRDVNWTLTLGGGDDNSFKNGFELQFIDNGNGYGFSTLRIKDIFVNGGLVNEKRHVLGILPCNNLTIQTGAEFVGKARISGNLVNNGVFTGDLVCATNFGSSTFSANSLNQYISGSGLFRKDTLSQYPSSQAENSVPSFMVHSNANIYLGVPLIVEELMLKGGTIVTSNNAILSLGSTGKLGVLGQTNSGYNYVITEFTGNIESWTGGYINGPFRRFFNNPTLSNKSILPIGKNGIIKPIAVRFNNTNPTYVWAEYNNSDPGTSCVPLLNEQGLNISNTSPSGHWVIEADESCGAYEIDFKTSGFLKRGGGGITDLPNLRMIKRLQGNDWANSCSENYSAPLSLNKVTYKSPNTKTCKDSTVIAELKVNSAYYTKNVTWSIVNDENQIVHSGGPLKCSSQTMYLPLGNNCYTLNINISYSGLPNSCTYYDTLFTLWVQNELLHFGLQTMQGSSHEFSFCINNGNIETYPTNCTTLKSEFALGGANNAVGNSIVPANHMVLNNQDSGVGSLRYFVDLAACNDTIRFDPILNNDTITLLSNLAVDNKNIFIIAQNDQNISVRINIDESIFDIEAQKVVLLDNLKLIASGTFDGYVINNKGNLTIKDLDVSTGNTQNPHAQILNTEGGTINFIGLNILRKN